MLSRYLTRWGWSALKRMGATLDDIDACIRADADDELTETQAEELEAAVAAAWRLATSLISGRVAGPSEKQ